LRFTAEATNNKLLLEKKKEIINILEQEGCKYLNDCGVKLIE
jgi:hypothetical protein